MKQTYAAVIVIVCLLVSCSSPKAGIQNEPSSSQSAISNNAESFVFPQMTVQNQEYFDKYIYPLSPTKIWATDFNETSFPPFLVSYVFSVIVSEEKAQELIDDNMMIDQNIVEDAIMEYFPATRQDIRNAAGADYLPERGTYIIRLGFGGMGYKGVITQSEWNEDLLTLYTDWYTWSDKENDYAELKWQAQTVVQVFTDGKYKYISNHIL